MTSHVLQRIEEDAARFGFTKLMRHGTTAKVVWRLKCSKCPRDFQAFWSPDTSPSLMVKNVRMRKWDVGQGDRPLCPECAHPHKDHAPEKKPNSQSFERWIDPYAKKPTPMYEAMAKAVEVKMKEEVVPSLTEQIIALHEADPEMLKSQIAAKLLCDPSYVRAVGQRHGLKFIDGRGRHLNSIKGLGSRWAQNTPPPPTVVATTPAMEQKLEEAKKMEVRPNPSPKITHLVFQMLDSVMDAGKRLYKLGYDDDKVAKECGTTREIVAYLRRETFGELAQDPRVQVLRDDIDLMSMQLEEIRKNTEASLKEMRSRLDQIAQNLAR